MVNTRVRTVIFFGILIGAVALCVALVWPFLPLIGWSLTLAVTTWPAYRRLNLWLKRPSAAAALTTTLALTVIVVPAVLLGIRLVHEAKSLAGTNHSLGGQSLASPKPRIQAVPAVRSALSWIESWVELPPMEPEAAIRSTAAEAGRAIGRYSVTLVKNAAWGSIQLVIMTITLFFMLRDGHNLRGEVSYYIPLDENQTNRVLQKVSDAISATVIGNGVVALVQGMLAGIAYIAVGLPSPVLWTVVTIVLCLIPVLGAPVVWGPAAILLALQGEIGASIGLALWGLLAVGTIDNLLRPILIGQKTRMHPLPVFFSVVGGTLLMGPLGLFMGPVILSGMAALLQEFRLHGEDDSTLVESLPNSSHSDASKSLQEIGL